MKNINNNAPSLDENNNLNNKKLSERYQGLKETINSNFKGSQYNNSDHNFSDYKNEKGNRTHRFGEFNYSEE